MAQAQLAKRDPIRSSGAGSGQSTAGYQGGLARTLVRTLLVFTFIPLALMGGAAYLRSRALLQSQVVAQMQVQIVDQVGDVDLSIKTKRIRLDRLVRNADFQSTAQRALNSGGVGVESLRTEMNELVRATSLEGGRATFNHYFLMDLSGRIVLGSKPEWDGVLLRRDAGLRHAGAERPPLLHLLRFRAALRQPTGAADGFQIRGPGAAPIGHRWSASPRPASWRASCATWPAPARAQKRFS